MRILQLIDSLDAGGAERMAVNYANAIFSEVKFSALCTTRKEGQLKGIIYDEVTYLFLNKKKSFDLNAILRLRRFVKENQINIIHAHSTSFFIAVLLKLSYPKIKIIWHDHFGGRANQSKNKNLILKFCSLFFDSVLTINLQNKKWLEDFLWTKKISYFPNFISPQANSIALTYLSGQKGKRIVFLANLRKPKNHIQFLNAFYESSAISKGWSLHLIGKDYCDEYSQEIKNFINIHNIDNSVFLYDSCSDVLNVLSQSDIGVLCSTHEGFPVTLLEYGYSKLAVLSTNVGYCATIVENEKSGFTFSPDSSDEIKKKLEKLLEDETTRFRFSQNLYSQVIDNYTSSAVINSYLAFLKK